MAYATRFQQHQPARGQNPLAATGREPGSLALQKLRLLSLAHGPLLRAFAGRVSRLGVFSKPIGHRTKTEHLATILLPNPVAAHDTKQDAVDCPAKIPKENRTVLNGSSPAEMTETEFRVRCIRPLSNSRNAGADQIVRRPASPRSAFAGRGGGVCLHGGLRQDRHSIQVRMRTLLGIGGRQDRGVRSPRGSKLTGIRQGKSRRRIKIITPNQ
jgi:hypothetical protein